jgi:hypothetical protein
MAEPRIRTRCPSCGSDTLIIDDAGHLVCSLIGCAKPTMIGDAAAEIARLKADAAKDAEIIAHLKAAGAAMRKALVCFNIRRHPRTSISRDESERVVNEWDDAVNGTWRRAK